MAHVLLVDGDQNHASLLTNLLQSQGFEVTHAATHARALERLGMRPDIVVLDPDVPDGGGFTALRDLRSAPEGAAVPLLVLTRRGDEIDRVVAFELGADDYVVRPYSPRELPLRLRAILRRSHPRSAPQAGAATKLGRIRLSAAERRMWLDGAAYPMTVAELRLLEVLASTPGRVWSRQALLAEAWPEGDVQLRTIDVHVRRLREKLGPHADLIETVRGVGYRVGGPYTV